MLDYGGGKEGSGVWAAKVLLPLNISARGRIERQEYGILLYLKVTRRVDTADEKPGYVFLR